MMRNIRRTVVGALALATVAVGCAPGESSEQSLKGAKQGLGGPDFVVTALSGPTSTLPGWPFNVTVTVCNQGDSGSGTEVALVLSDDSSLSLATDFWAGSVYLGYLSPGACETQTVEVNPAQPNGAWYLGALADPYDLEFEPDESNNTRLSGPMGVGYGPDFIITAVEGPSSAEPGLGLTARVTVCNQGTAASPTEVALYLSADEFIQPSTGPGPHEDALVGMAFVDSLLPGRCATVPVTGSATPPSPGTEGPWYVGAATDPNYVSDELIEDNNTHSGYRLGVGYQPDFVVTQVKGPRGVQSGQEFIARVTVCNQGTRADSADVELYLSADEFIQPSTGPGPHEDSLVGMASAGFLDAGGCATVPVTGFALPPFPGYEGAYHLGAVVDPANTRVELMEDNNTSSGHRIGVGYGPDFVITGVTGPASVLPGQGLTARVTVCNQGTRADSADVELYLSADEFIQPSTGPGPQQDSLVGMASVGFLDAGGCATVPVTGSASPPFPGYEGAYHLGAVVDPANTRMELMEDNNTSSGYRIGVGNRPDFVVTGVTGPANAAPGEEQTLRATVCNQGTVSGDTDLGIYLSADAVILPDSGPQEDPPFGMVSTGTLQPGQCQTLDVWGGIYIPYPFTEGPYHVGAVADPWGQRSELIEDNNTHSSYRMGVGNRPDFIVTSVTGPPSAQPGQGLPVQITVCNQGTQGGDTAVEMYLSADDVIRPHPGPGPLEDVPAGQALVDFLAPGQCRTLKVQGVANLPLPGNEGVYHLGAVVDPWALRPELIEDNNTHSTYRIGVGNRPDFVVTSVTGPASALPGQGLPVRVTVCNQGTQSGVTEVELFVSADDVIRARPGPGPEEDVPVGQASAGFLVPGQCRTLKVQGVANLPLPGNEGVYHLGVVVDPVTSQAELNEDNNTHSNYRIGVGNRPDFVVTGVHGPPSVQEGQPHGARVTVCNQGTTWGEALVELYLSADAIPRPPTGEGPLEDSLVGSGSSGDLAPGQCTTLAMPGVAAPPPRSGIESAWYLGAVVDPHQQRPELIEDNNTASGYLIGVGNRPDFVVTGVKGPASVQEGQALTAQVTVCNQGTTWSETNVELYLSADAIPRPLTAGGPPEDSLVGGTYVPPLSPGWCTTVSVMGNAWLPPSGTPGAWHLAAMVEPHRQRPELIEDNNTSPGYRIGVGSRPDFVVTAVTGPHSVTPGSTFSTNVIFCNRGQQAGTVDVDLYLSEDTTIRPLSAEDFSLGTVAGVMLNPGQCTNRTVSVIAPGVMDGAYSLGAVVDATGSREELLEDNNILTGTRIGVGSQPDFVVTSVTAAHSVKPGSTFSTSVTVCNRGRQSSAVDVDVYLSTDNAIRPASPPLPSDDILLGTLVGVSVTPGMCASRTLSATAPSAVGAFYLGAVADPFGRSEEFIEDNNILMGSRIGVGYQADFVVTSVSAPASVRQGSTFTVNVTVCNRGQAAGSTDVDLLLSVDDVIRPQPATLPPTAFLLGTVTGMSLNTGQCVSRSRLVNADIPFTGAYYVGASADTNGATPELLEDNNALAGAVVSVVTP